MCEIVKITAEWNFSNVEISLFFNSSNIYSAEVFLILPVSSSVRNKKDFYRLNFKIDAIDGKKWVKFVAM